MAIAFKEWSLVCDALGAGDQAIILRKGGIAEGRDGFQFKHPEFFLFPTHFHEQAKYLNLPADVSVPEVVDGEREQITVEYFAELVATHVVTDWEKVQALAPLHYWTEETVRERFDYEDCPGISLALVRVSRLVRPWSFPNSKRYGGCRSWVEIPEPPADVFAGRVAVLEEAAMAELQSKIGELV